MSQEAIAGYVTTLRGDETQTDVAKRLGLKRTADISKLENLVTKQPSADFLVPYIQAVGGRLVHLAELAKKDASRMDGIKLAEAWLKQTKGLNADQRRRLDEMLNQSNQEDFEDLLNQLREGGQNQDGLAGPESSPLSPQAG